MSNSNLSTYVDTGSGNYNFRTLPISRITIHTMPGMTECSQLSNLINSGRECSWNYGIGEDGTIGLLVEEKYRAWASSSPDNDHRAVNIIVLTSCTTNDRSISSSAYTSLISLCTDVCRRNKIPKLTYTGELSGSNLTRHNMFVSCNCPGSYLESKYIDIATQVNDNLLKEATTSVTEFSSYDGNVLGTTVDPNTVINRDSIKPYVATLSHNCSDVDYYQLKSAGVVGVMLYGGAYYDTIHLVNDRYRNPNLRQLVKQADAAQLRYGIYVDVRARSIHEAELECRQLYYIVSAHPPKLGIWLHLELVKDQAINNGILHTYYDYITQWGLIGYCGLYVNRSELEKITWDIFKDSFYLWLDDHISSLADIDQILTPALFKL